MPRGPAPGPDRPWGLASPPPSAAAHPVSRSVGRQSPSSSRFWSRSYAPSSAPSSLDPQAVSPETLSLSRHQRVVGGADWAGDVGIVGMLSEHKKYAGESGHCSAAPACRRKRVMRSRKDPQQERGRTSSARPLLLTGFQALSIPFWTER